MKDYKGIVRIRCERKKGLCQRNPGNDVQPGCMDCPEAVTEVVGLEGKSIYEYRAAGKEASRKRGLRSVPEGLEERFAGGG